MNILVVDSQGLLSERQTAYARNRLYFSLLRFEHRINGATMHFARHGENDSVRCYINVNIEGSATVSIKRTANSTNEVVAFAVDAIEPKVACRVDWKAWFNADTFATWMVSISQRWRSWVGTSALPPTNSQPISLRSPNV